MLRWSLDVLSEKSGIGTTTLKRFESAELVPNGQIRTLENLVKAFEDAGVEFIGTPEQGAGVRWKNK
jgi:transcriptional regulator with XRE-family HTH domain